LPKKLAFLVKVFAEQKSLRTPLRSPVVLPLVLALPGTVGVAVGVGVGVIAAAHSGLGSQGSFLSVPASISSMLSIPSPSESLGAPPPLEW
jgi:ABC-type cobalamin transport system permease subunit